MAIIKSGRITFTMIANEFGKASGSRIPLGNYYRGKTYVPDNTQTAKVPKTGRIAMGNFYGSEKVVVVPGSKRFDNDGSLVIPEYNWLRITVVAAGGGGGAYGWNGSSMTTSGDGKAGGDSSVVYNGSTITRAYGGGGGKSVQVDRDGGLTRYSSGSNGASGTGSGGDTNSTGGGAIGGQGGEFINRDSGRSYGTGGTGGNGGKAVETFARGDLTVGKTLSVYAGNGGAPGTYSYWNGDVDPTPKTGSNGYVLIEWGI